MINFDTSIVEELIEKIENADNIYMASHIQPDGDNLGSLLGLGMALKQLNKNIYLIKVDDIPKDYMFLPNIDKIKEYPESEEVDLFIALDCGDINRLGYAKTIAEKANNLINIDHHKTNTKFGSINIVYPDLSSTGEIVYEVIKALNLEIDKDIATAIYTALSTDTGSFIYSNTTSRTYQIAGELIEYGIDLNDIVINLYQSKSLASTKVYIDSLNTLEFHFNDKVSTIYVSEEMLEKNGATWDDTEGLISFARDIKGIEVACLLKEYSKNEIKLSLRSKNSVDVSKVSEVFGGGGHKKAAGCTIEDTLENSKLRVLKEIEKYI